METKIDIVLTDPHYNMCCKHRRQISDYGALSDEALAEMVEKCGDYLNLGGHTHMFCFLVQLSLWVKAIFNFTEIIIF